MPKPDRKGENLSQQRISGIVQSQCKWSGQAYTHFISSFTFSFFPLVTMQLTIAYVPHTGEWRPVNEVRVVLTQAVTDRGGQITSHIVI